MMVRWEGIYILRYQRDSIMWCRPVYEASNRIVVCGKSSLLRQLSKSSKSPHIPTLLKLHAGSLAHKLDSGELNISQSSFIQSFAKCIEMKEYDSLVELYDNLGPTHSLMNSEVSLLTAFAFSGLNQPNKVCQYSP